MPEYSCKCCNFNSQYKNDYHRHLRTNKHLNNLRNNTIYLNKKLLGEKKPNIIQNNPITIQNNPKIIQNNPKIIQNNPADLEEKILTCKFCNKSFTLETNKIRHELHRCKENPDIILKNGRRINIKNKKKLVKLIENLFDKHAGSGNGSNNNNNIGSINNNSHNTNNTNNTIILNNYGEEDMSHITDKMKMNMIKLPFNSIQKMIEQVHFSKKKPENRNIEIPNKKQKIIKLYKNNKWAYKDSTEIIGDMINTNYDRIEDYYEFDAKQKISDLHSNRYKRFQNKFDHNDKILIDGIKKDVELLIMSANLE